MRLQKLTRKRIKLVRSLKTKTRRERIKTGHNERITTWGKENAGLCNSTRGPGLAKADREKTTKKI